MFQFRFTTADSRENPPSLSITSEALAFWVGILGVREGDQISLSVTDPYGVEFVRRDIAQDKTRARQFYFTGRKLDGKTVPIGIYKGEVVLKRQGISDVSRSFNVRME